MVFAAFEAANKSVSSSKQFIVYCKDVPLRLHISSFAEATKSEVLVLMGQKDAWKAPIIINVEPADIRRPNQLSSQVKLFEVEGGFKVQVDILLGAESSEAQLQKQIVKAVFLEFAYRDDEEIKSGDDYFEPPSWLLEGTVQFIQIRRDGANADLFKTLLDRIQLPSLKAFLLRDIAHEDSTSIRLYQACSVSLLQLLIDMQGGRSCLVEYITSLRKNTGDTVFDLLAHFPALGGSEQSLEKWWTLSMARFSAADRYRGLSIESSEKRLLALLSFKLAINKKGETADLSIEEVKDFLKSPKNREILAATDAEFMALGAQAHPLFRPVILDYQNIVSNLARGKTKGIQNRLADAARYREMVLTRINDITDYLNWYEATQMVTQSNSFNNYFKAARETFTASKRQDSISRYVDSIEAEFE